MLRTWFRIAPEAMLAVDRLGQIVLANTQAEHMFGYAPMALEGCAAEALLPESLRDAYRAHQRIYATRPRIRPIGTPELLGLRHDGRSFPLEIGLAPVTTEQGTVTLVSLRDVSNSRRARRERTHARRAAYDASMSRLALESPDHELAIRRILELAVAALELPAAAILSSRWQGSGLHVSVSVALPDAIARTLASMLGAMDSIGDATRLMERGVTTATLTQDEPQGSHRAALADAGYRAFAVIPLAEPHEPPSVLVALATAPASFDDDSVAFLQSTAYRLASALQRSQLEERLAHALRLDAVGQLTGGIAHDFNNLMTVVSGNLQLLQAELATRSDLQEIVDSATRAVDRGVSLTHRLLAFARRQPLQPRAVVPKPLLDELGHMLRRTLGKTIQVQVSCPADIPDVYVDPNELDAALVNLALNARDAMSRGGELYINAREIRLDSSSNPQKLPRGHYVVFEVRDTGTGMSPDVQAHVFEPFFTTKESGQGSGLGLSMVHGFAAQSGGGIAIDSRLGYGTRVELVLPVVNPETVETADVRVGTDAHAKRIIKILIVEDEMDVRVIASRFLSAVGYQVLVAANADAGLDLLATNPDVDLLFSDVVLGRGMNGVELALKARRVRPQLAVLLTSGHPGPIGRQGQDASAGAFKMLRKPYRREQLLDAIHRLMDNA